MHSLNLPGCFDAGVPPEKYIVGVSASAALHASDGERTHLADAGSAGDVDWHISDLVHCLDCCGIAFGAPDCGAIPPNPL